MRRLHYTGLNSSDEMSSNERHYAETSVEDVAKYLEQSPNNSENPDDIQNLCASNSQQRECRLRQTHVSQGSDHSHPSWENAPNSNTTEGNRPWSEKGVKSFEISTLEDASDGAPTERGGRRQDTGELHQLWVKYSHRQQS